MNEAYSFLYRKKDENQFYGMASQIKLLMNMPEKVYLPLYLRTWINVKISTPFPTIMH